MGSTGSPTEGFASRMLKTGLLLDKYYTPLLCLFGALGNSLSLAVFCLDSKYRSQSSSYYLSALAVSDTGFLLNLFAVWLDNLYGGVITSDWMCPLVMYLGQVACFMSVYLMVAFSIERYVAVHYPFSRPRICTRSKAKKGIFGLTLVALLLFSYAWVIAKVVETKSPSSSARQTLGKGGGGSGKSQQFFLANFSTFGGEGEINPVKNNTLLEEDDGAADAKNNIEHFPAILAELSAFVAQGEEERRRGKVGDWLESPEIKRFHKTSTRKSQKGNNDSGNRSIKIVEGKAADAGKGEEDEETKDKTGNYFQLIEDNGIIQEQQQSPPPPSSLQRGVTSAAVESIFPEEASPAVNITRITLPVSFRNLSLFPVTDTPRTTQRGNRNGTRIVCSVPKRYHKISAIANYLDTAVTLIIPFLLITYFNVRISLSVWKLKDQRQQIVASPSITAKARTTLVVTDNRPGRRLQPTSTKVVNTHHNLLLPSHPHYSSATLPVSSSLRGNPFEADIDENGVCHWHLEQEESETGAGVRFEDISAGVCHFTVNQNGVERVALNESHQTSLESGKRISPGRENSSGMKRDFSIFRRGENSRAPYRPHHHPSSEVRVTKTLLLVSTVFLVLNLPLHAIRCTQFIQSVTGTQEGKDILRALQPWANLTFNTNFAVNFLLYCASGRNFRKSLKHIASRIFRKTRQRASHSASHSQHHHRHVCTDSRRLSEHDRKWRKRRSSALLDERTGTQNVSNCCHNPTVTTVVKEPRATEFLELEDIVAGIGIGIEADSVYLTTDNGHEERITV